MRSAFLKRHDSEKSTYVTIERYEEMEKEITALKEELKRERETVDFYANPEKWMKKTSSGWDNTSPRWHGDEELILDYEHPGKDWKGTIKPGGKLARETQKQRKIEL